MEVLIARIVGRLIGIGLGVLVVLPIMLGIFGITFAGLTKAL